MSPWLRSVPARVAALVTTAAAVALGSVVVAAPASAHDQLVASDPAADSTVETLPEEMTLVYSGELIDAGDGTAVEVVSPSGDDIAGALSLDGTDLTVALDGGEAGEYTVTWRVVSSDGHPVDGTFAFAVETGAPTDESPDAQDEQTDAAGQEAEDEQTAQPAPQTSGDGSDGAFPTSAPWIVVGIVVIAAGGAVVALLVGRTRRLGEDDPRTGRGPSAGPDRR